MNWSSKRDALAKNSTERQCTSTEVRGDYKIVLAQHISQITEDDFFFQYASKELQELQEDKEQQ
jgi:hypothetical protein